MHSDPAGVCRGHYDGDGVEHPVVVRDLIWQVIKAIGCALKLVSSEGSVYDRDVDPGLASANGELIANQSVGIAAVLEAQTGVDDAPQVCLTRDRLRS